MLTETVANVLARARRYADAETSTQANDFVNDTELNDYLNISYRRLIDMVIDSNGQDLLSPTDVTLTAPTYTLPSDFMHPLSLEKPDGSKFRTLPMFNFHERNFDYSPSFPAWRIIGTSLRLQPAPTGIELGSLRLWYLPTATALTSGAFQVFGGWDDFLSLDIAVQILIKEDRDSRALQEERTRAEKRIRASCAGHLAGTPDRIGQVMVYPEDRFGRYGVYGDHESGD
jgi:hypothetical protein